MNAILKGPVDLLWFGGIGTYVKASSQPHAEVGDPANDAIRVDGNEVRARAIGEGANLGITQAGRIEFSEKGGRINTDFIDNSAGVDCSDKEVNIKIPLNREMREGRLSFEKRNALLVKMTDDVSEMVLEDNRLQTLALSIAESGGSRALPAFVRTIELLESAGRIDRKVEGLSSSEELLRRGQENKGLTRPELAVVLSMSKLALQDAAEDLKLADDKIVERELYEAFPKADAQAACRRDPHPPAAQRNPGDAGRQSPRQPPRPERRARPDGRRGRVAGARDFGVPRRRAPARPSETVGGDRDDGPAGNGPRRAVRDRREQRARASVRHPAGDGRREQPQHALQAARAGRPQRSPPRRAS